MKVLHLHDAPNLDPINFGYKPLLSSFLFALFVLSDFFFFFLLLQISPIFRLVSDNELIGMNKFLICR